MTTHNTTNTPFDDLVEEKATRRPTQPLPPRLVPPRSRGGRLPVPTGDLTVGDLPEDDTNNATSTFGSTSGSTYSGAATPAPAAAPIITPGGPLPVANQDLDFGDPGRMTGVLLRVPTIPLIGFSILGGVLMVICVSTAVRFLVPRPAVNERGMVDGNTTVPVAQPAEAEVEVESEPALAPKTEAPKDEPAVVEADTGPGERFEDSRRGYAIQTPAGFKLQRRGRRTEWQGPNGAQLVVETTTDINGSPRENWEQLDRSLSRKYGSRYRNLGITETEVAGRPAAVWEFEIEDEDGKVTRKIDVGIHANGRGYAVLGVAPADRFDAVRPRLEEAVRSLELNAPTAEVAASTPRDVPTSDRSSNDRPSTETPQRNTEQREASARDVSRRERSESDTATPATTPRAAEKPAASTRATPRDHATPRERSTPRETNRERPSTRRSRESRDSRPPAPPAAEAPPAPHVEDDDEAMYPGY